jgi:LacI family transcriptional regulator
LLDLLNRLNVPVISIDRPVFNSPIVSVVTDNFEGARSGVRHLISHGRKNVACLTGESTLFTIHERIRGYRAAVESAGLPCILDSSVQDYKSAEEAIRRLLAGPNPPDAIFTLKNSSTIYAFEVLQKLNVNVPEKVALLGFDDFELASTVRPSISVVQQPVEEIGRVAAELLFDQLLGRRSTGITARPNRTRRVTLQTRLIPRASCGCPSPVIEGHEDSTS